MSHVIRRFCVAAFVGTIVTASAHAQFVPDDVVGYLGQEGQLSSDGHDLNSWSPNHVPTATERALFNGGGGFNKVVELGSTDVHWGQMQFNNNGPTQINGTGTIFLDIPLNSEIGGPLSAGMVDQWGVWSNGGAQSSIINPNVVTKSYIETNDHHNLTFNGNVEALTIQAYAASTVTFNGNVTLTGDDLLDNAIFLTGNETLPQITFNKNVNLAPWSNELDPEIPVIGFFIRNNMTVNLGPNSSLTSIDPNHPSGWGEVNMYNGSKIRLFGNNKIGTQTQLWSRDNPTLTNTLDLNGFSDSVGFLGTHPTATFILDYGTAAVANSFAWDTTDNMAGAYEVVNFKIGTDTLTLGTPNDPFWFQTGDPTAEADLLATVKIDGFSYAPFNPAVLTPYWTVLNPASSRTVVFQNIATPNADFNHDTIVDGDDILNWQDHLGLTGQTNNDNGDADRLGTVNAADLVIIKDQFGTNPNAVAAAGAIPEPATLSMLVIGACGAGLAHRRRGRR